MHAFISYSHRDEAVLERLHVHLAPLKRDGLLSTWYDREISAGSEIDPAITEKLEYSELILLLVSPDFLASDYCAEREMRQALERHQTGDACVVPIIIEPCDWASSPLREIRALPLDGKPVSDWANPNHAYLNIVQELRQMVSAEEVSPTSASAITSPTKATEPSGVASRYRVTHDFDEIDQSNFRDATYKIFYDYFQEAVNEINTVNGLRGRFASHSPTSFSCTIINKARDRGTAHITVHKSHSDSVMAFGMGDIYYSFEENAAPNMSSGGFHIESDEYELYLTAMMMRLEYRFTDGPERFTPANAAECLWENFLERAGISYA